MSEEPRVAAHVRIYLGVRQDILRNAIKPETILSENELASEYGTSRTPAREALARLRHEGFVALTPRKGNVVTRPSMREILEGYYLRSILEGAACELAAARQTNEAMRQLEECLSPASDTEVGPLNRTFHTLVARMSGNEKLESAISQILDELERAIFLDPAMWSTALLVEHRRIVEALRSRDGPRARAEMIRHVDASKGRILGRV